MQENHREPPQFAPVSQLPSLGPHLDGLLALASEQLVSLSQAQRTPHLLDDATVKRVLAVYQDQRDDLDLFDELLTRWSAEPGLSLAQHSEIKRLQAVMVTLHKRVTMILTLAGELKQGTIERILEMDDAELGLRFLRGDLPGQKRQAGKTQPDGR